VRKTKTEFEEAAIKLGKQLLRVIEKYYELPYKAFYLRSAKTMRPAKACRDQNLSELRTVAFFCMMQAYQKQLSDNCYVEVFGLDRTCIISMRQVGKNLFATSDEKFLDQYAVVYPLWEKIITNSLQK